MTNLSRLQGAPTDVSIVVGASCRREQTLLLKFRKNNLTPFHSLLRLYK